MCYNVADLSSDPLSTLRRPDPVSIGSHWPEIVAVILLIGAAAFFSGSEAAMISLSRLRARGRWWNAACAARTRSCTCSTTATAFYLRPDRQHGRAARGGLARDLLFIHAGVPQCRLVVDGHHGGRAAAVRRDHPEDNRGRDSERWALRLAPLTRTGRVGHDARSTRRFSSSTELDRAHVRRFSPFRMARSSRKPTSGTLSTSAPNRTCSRKRSAR